MSAKQTKSRPASRGRNRSRARSRSSVSWWWIVGGIIVVLGIAAVIASSMSGDDDAATDATQETAPVTVDGAALPSFPGNDENDPAVGDVAPVLSGENFDGRAVSIGGATGTPQIVVFLSHSCPHCQAEVPRIVDLAQDGAFDGLDVVAVATNTSSTFANYPPSAWLEREDWPFPVLLDDERGTAATAYGLTAFPYFVFLDSDGVVVGRLTGEVDPDSMVAIANALRAGAPLNLPGNDGGSTSAS